MLLLGAVATVFVAAGEVGDEVAFLELAILRCGGAVCVCVDEILGDHGELGEDRAVPSRLVSGCLFL